MQSSPGGGEHADATVFVARQPIFTRDLRVYGYELLFRTSTANTFPGIDGTTASAALMADTILTSGLATLTGARPAFINFTRALLVGEFYTVLPRERVVIELLEDVPADEQVLEACARLKERGYRLALDDIGAPTERDLRLAPFADIIKVDLRATTAEERAGLRGHLPTRHCQFLAEKVETLAELRECAAAGYDYFQGYFLDRPTVVTRPGMRSFAPTVTKLLAAASRPDFDFDEVDAIIKTDLALCYKMLRFANAAANGLRTPITSVRHALVLLGRDQIVRAVSLLAMSSLLDGVPSELTVSSLVRARLLESLAGSGALDGSPLDLFLLGMFSRLEAVLGESFGEALAVISVSDAVRSTLLGAPGPLQRAITLAVAHERGDWPTMLEVARELAIDPATITRRYRDAVAFADSALQS